MTEIRAEQKYVLASPRKVALVADAVRRLSPVAAVEYLAASRKRAAGTFLKVLKQALANARNNFKLNVNELTFGEIQVNAGPKFKRGRAGARGMHKPYSRKTAHIKLVLVGKETKAAVKSAPKVVVGEVKEKVLVGGEQPAREVGEEEMGAKQGRRGRESAEVRKVQRRTTHK